MRKTLSFIVVLVLLLSSMIFGIDARDAYADETFMLNATAGNGVVRLWWDEVPGAEQGYYLYRGNESGGQYLMPLTDFGIMGNTYFDVNVENGTNYCYYCRALDEKALSFARSNEVCVSVMEDLPEFIQSCKLVLTFTIDSAEYLVNGVKKMMSTPCIIRNNRTFLLIRYVAEEIGGVVSWDGEERKVTVEYKDKTIEMWIGKSSARVNGVDKPIDPNNPRVVPFIENGRTHVPLRFPVESFGEGEVKWFASTKQAVLSFPDRCEETLEGVLTRYSSASGLGQLMTFNGEPHLLANMNALQNRFVPVIGDCLSVTGRNDNPDYPGYLFASKAELIDCVDDGIRHWNGTVTKLDCDKKAIFFDDEYGSAQVIRFTENDSLLIGYCHKLSAGDCISISGKVSSSENIRGIYIEPISIQRIDCPGEVEELECSGDWYTGHIISIDCMSYIALVEIDGERMKVTLPERFDCTSIDPTWCVRFCATRTGTDTLEADIFSAYPCDDEVCDGVLYSGKIISVSTDANTLKLSQGETYLVFDVSGLNVQQFLDYKCAEVCAYQTINAKGESVLVARSVTEVDCSVMCEGRIIQARIERISSDCSEMIVRTLSEDIQLSLIIEDKSLCNLSINSCYKICLRPNVRCLCAISAVPMVCPTECGGMQVIGSIKDVKNSVVVIELYGSSKIYKASINSEQASSIEKGMCVEACLKFELDGTSSLEWFRELDPEKCGQIEDKTCDDLEMIVHIKDVDCVNNSMSIKIIDGFSMMKGMEMDIPIDESVMKCEEIEKDTCIRVCGKLKGFSDFELIWWEIIDPELCGITEKPVMECDEEVKGVIVYLGCREDDKIQLSVDGETMTYISMDVGVCSDFEVGDCVSTCLKIIDGAPPVILSMEKLNPSECPTVADECAEEVVGRITDIGCTAYGYLKLNTLDGKRELVIRDYDVCEGFSIGDCVKACIMMDTYETLIVDSMEKLDDRECPAIEKPECNEFVKIDISRVFCEEGYIEGIEVLTVEARTPMPLRIHFEDESFCRMQTSKCYEVCYLTDDDGVMWGERFKEIDCMGQSFCDGREIDVTVIAVSCKDEWIAVDYWNEVLKIKINPDDCDVFTQGQCIRMCISKDDDGYYVLDHYKVLADRDCPGGDCIGGRWISGRVIAMDSYPDIGGFTFTMYGYSAVFLYPVEKTQSYLPFGEGDCIKACAAYDTETGMLSVSNVIIILEDICGEDVLDGDIWRGTVQSIDGEREIISIKRGSSILAVRVSYEICTRFSEGDCIATGGHWQPENQTFISKWFRHLPWEMCNARCTGDEVTGSVVDLDIENSKIVFFTEENIIEIKSDADLANLAPGTCLKVCVDGWDEEIRMYRSSRLEIVDCIDTPVCKENIIRGIVSEHSVNLFVWVAGNRYQVEGVSGEIPFRPGTCVLICGTFMGEESTYNPMPIYINAEWVSVLPPDECEDGFDVIMGVVSDVDELGQGVIETRDGFFEIHVPVDIANETDYPACVKAYGRRIPLRQLFVASRVEQIPSSECDWCGNDYLKASLMSVNEDELFGFIAYGGFLERIQFDSYKVLESTINRVPYITYPLCVEMCGNRNEYDGVFNINQMRILKGSSCDSVCEGLAFTGVVKETDHKTGIMKLDYMRDVDVEYPEFLKIPPYIDFEIGRCVSICTQPMSIWDTMVDMPWYPTVIRGEYLSDEQCVTPEPEPEEDLPVWEGVITETYCIENLLYCNFNDVEYTVIVPDDIKCEQFNVNDCVKVVGEYDEKYQIIKAVKIERIDCPEETETWDMIIFDTKCDTRSKPFYIARAKTSFYDVYLPDRFKCATFSPGDCITVSGTLEGNDSVIGTPINTYIQATSIKSRKCEEYGPYNATVVVAYCDSRFIKVKYFDNEYDLYYPASFKCNSLTKGDCISFKGVIWTEGYIDATWLRETKCSRESESLVDGVSCCNSQSSYTLISPMYAIPF